jgi:lipoyl(octanoyl) transferase
MRAIQSILTEWSGMQLGIIEPGMIEYADALKIQEKLMLLRQNGRVGDMLLLLEHPPVLTIGRRGSSANIRISPEELESAGVSVYEASRGGDVTYHGPGQIVGYPIMDLNGRGRDIKSFVWRIEEVFIRLLEAEFGIKAGRDEGKYTGVWVGNEKITAIGIAVKRWVTMHGFAFNVNTDLEHFKWIVPCGITDRGVTSLGKLLGRPLDMGAMNRKVASYFCGVFNMEPRPVGMDEIADLVVRNEGDL